MFKKKKKSVLWSSNFRLQLQFIHLEFVWQYFYLDEVGKLKLSLHLQQFQLRWKKRRSTAAEASEFKSHMYRRCAPNNKPCMSHAAALEGKCWGVGSPYFTRWGLGGHCWEQPLACYCELPSGTNYCGSPPPVSCLSPGLSMPASVVATSANTKKNPSTQTGCRGTVSDVPQSHRPSVTRLPSCWYCSL